LFPLCQVTWRFDINLFISGVIQGLLLLSD
jgi:hypothetical protein